VSLPDPRTAPRRDDLPWLRRRPRAGAERTAPQPLSMVHPKRASTAAPAAAAAPSAPARSSLDLSTPAPPPPPPAPARSAPARSSLDLSTPAPPPPPAPARSLLDLSTPDPRPQQRPRARPAASAAAGDLVLGFVPERTFAGTRTVLTADQPTVVLTAVQAGVGALVVRAAVGADVGDLRLACAYLLRSGQTSVVLDADGLRVAPIGTRRPMIVVGHDGGETITVDLRQVVELRRLVVFAYSASGAAVRWSGALVVTTTGGARVDVLLDREPAAGVLAALSIHDVGGQLVLRAEQDLVPGLLRDACVAHGFDRITWVDAARPLV